MEDFYKPSHLSGLTSEQVRIKKEKGKQNIQPEKVTKSTGQILKDNICTLFNLFNVLIAIALALVGAWSNMLFILIIALNTLIGIVQELHAKKLVEKLSLLSTPTAKVIRDENTLELSVQELVEEDIIELEAGKQVCSDSVILAGEVEVNESLLTGESDPISKSEGDHLLSGSFIVSGKCRACVEHVGSENYAAKIAREAKKLRGVHSELLSSMRKVTRFTGFLIPPLGILLFLEAFLLRNDTLNHSVVTTAAFQAMKEYFDLNHTFLPVRKIPFSSERKWSAMEFDHVGTFIIGAPERLGGTLPSYLQKDGEAGKRLLMAGIARDPIEPDRPLPAVEEFAYIVISDPIRPNAAKTLAYFKKEGVDLKLISGDNPVTVSALAKQAGFPEAERYIDMSGMTEAAEIEKAALNYSVFGRVSPLQKKQLVQALQKNGHSVAMTGDGVNDLLALREADCSIAVAEGSDAARQVSQVVLLDSDFSALPSVLSEGRRVVNNITRVAGVFFVKTIYSVLLSIVCLILNIPFPFLPIQITLIDLIIEGYPAFFMSFEPDGRKITGQFLPSVMRRAVPNAVSILICFLVLLVLSWAMPIPAAQFSVLLYLLVGTVGIQAVFKASWPFNKLRVFLCSTMTAGFYLAVFLFHHMLQVSLPVGLMLFLLASFILLSFLAERGVTCLIRSIGQRRNNHAGICNRNPQTTGKGKA